MQQQPVRYFFGQLRAVVRQLERHAYIHPVILVGVNRHLFESSLPPQNVVTAVARNAEHIWAELFGWVDLHEVHVQGHQRVLHDILRFVPIPDQAPNKPRQPRL